MKSLCLVILSAVCIEHDFKGFDDCILSGINWPRSPETLSSLEDESLNKEVLKVTTSHNEKYEYHLPELHVQETINIEDYDGPSPIFMQNLK
ncbi:unnamed protein product [Euphydryas editha]|uniref:Uncharacterized protein n=1 Tax=Euphydryas editha TaxID=104508 RepID=A0AAU9TX40_EUPED|nr:unnamed protein product [Euphydryas editha]